MQEKIKHVILIGSMKCGTTTLYDHLIKHPEIAKGIVKEPEYFSIKMGNPERKKGDYLNNFITESNKHKFTLDASTGYTKYPVEEGVPARIKNYGIEPYFIYIVRNPIDRIRSHYNFMKSDLSWKGKIDSPHLINTSKYFMQLEQYTQYFPKENILVVDFDELKKNPVALCDSIFTFIGASKFQISRDSNPVKNKTKPSNRTQVLVTNKLGFFAKYSPSFLNKKFKLFIRVLFPPREDLLTEKQEKRIKALLKDDMINLKTEFNIDVQKWRI